MPVFKKTNYRQLIQNITLTAIILLIPLLFFDRIYYATSIDPFLAMLTGAGFTVIMLWEKKEKDIFYSIYIWMLIATLVLSKDSGMIFALFLSVLYIVDFCLMQNDMKIKFTKLSAVHVMVTILAVLLPKMLWKWKLTATKAAISFESKIEGATLLDVVLGKDESYRSEVLENYIYALFEEHITLGSTGIELSYFMVLMIEAVLLYILLKYLYFKNQMTKKQTIIYTFVPVVQMIVFVLGMCVIYMFNFAEGEAVKLASLDRYLGTIFLAIGLIICLLAWKVISLVDIQRRRIYCIAFLTLIFLVAPLTDFLDMLSGANHEEAENTIGAMDILTEKIMMTCDGDDKIYIIAQEDSGFERLVLKYNIRPNRVNVSEPWSIGEPQDEDDLWSMPMTPEEWRGILVKDYDYVAIYRVNDLLFEDPDDIALNGLYRVDKETGILQPLQ